MKIFLLKGWKRKINLILRLIIIISLVVLLIAKLMEVLSNSLWPEEKPSGNPLRVYVESKQDI